MWSYFFIKWLFENLHNRLTGYRIGEVFSQNKNEIVIGFFRENNEDFYWILNLEPVFPHMRFLSDFKRARRNSANLFPELIDKKIQSFHMHDYERSFHFKIEDELLLIFKLHGGKANVILRDGNEIQLFRSQLKNDFEYEIPPGKTKNESEDILDQFPFLDKRAKQILLSSEWEDKMEEEKLQAIELLIAELNKPIAYIFQENDKWILSKLKPKSEFQEFINPFDACNKYSSLAGKINFLVQEKRVIVKELETRISKANKAIVKMEGRRRELTDSNEWEETANIIMANLHEFSNNKTEAELFDFYRQSNRIIKIKKNYSPQKYAEQLYKKSKNKQIEIDNLVSSIQQKNNLIEDLESKLEEASAIESPKAFKLWMKDAGFSSSKESMKEEPEFKTFNIDGYDIYVGRNARNNDVLTTKFARKDDIWMHAKDVGGSHVLIRRKNKEKIPISVIEKAASVAAWYSKGKNDTLFPVIYTERKYVRKAKGLAAGQVFVDKNDVVIVKPQLPEN